MEAQLKKESIISLLATTKLVFYTVLEFLNPEELKNLYAVLKQSPNYHDAPLLQTLQAYVYVRLQMMNTDRSFYFAVYDCSGFRKLEKLTLAFLVQSNNIFNQLSLGRHHNHNFITSILHKAQCPQLLDEIQQIYVDPQVPMLRLLRQTVGVGCTSTFQNFLVALPQDLYSMAVEEYPNLSEFYQKRTQQSYINQFFKIGRSKGRHPDFQKVKKLRLAAYLIKIGQTSTDQLPDNQMHNFLVGLFGMADEMAEASAAYIAGIQDPFYKLLQFCLRYSIYRNFVLSIQEKFAFIFELYSSLYEDYFQSEAVDIPAFSFWRPAYSKWYVATQKFHKELTDTYNYYLLTIRLKNINQSIEQMREQIRSEEYAVVRNYIQSIDIQSIAQLQKPINREVLEIIEGELIYCINEYNDIQMDLSIDEVTVNWCGYTKQKLAHPFLLFQKQIVQSTKLFYDVLFQSKGSPEMMAQIVEKDLTFVQNNQYYKHKIMSSIAKLARSYFTQPEGLNFTLNNLDEQIEDCNQNAELLEEIPCQLSRQLHQIRPLPEDEIIKYIEKPTIDTMDASDQSNLSDEEYHSDSELELPEDKKQEIRSFMQDENLEFSDQSEGIPQKFTYIGKCL